MIIKKRHKTKIKRNETKNKGIKAKERRIKHWWKMCEWIRKEGKKWKLIKWNKILIWK